MSKVIDYKDTWFQEISPRSYYDEDDLERTVIQNLEIIFPQFTAILFKMKLNDPVRSVNNIPDLAMVKKDYSEWFIIEVELGKHTLTHVVDQVTTFYNCSYVQDHAEYMYKQRPSSFDLKKMKTMVATVIPDFMVIVNEPKQDWIKPLKKLRCITCIFQIYQDYHGNPLYRLNGEHPYIFTKFSPCKYQKGLPYVVQVLEKDFLDKYGINNGDKLNVEYNGRTFQWERTDDSGGIYLTCNNPRPPLDPMSDRYRLNYILPIPPSSRITQVINFFKGKMNPSNYTFSFTKD